MNQLPHQLMLPGSKKRITCQSILFLNITARNGFANNAAIEMIGATICAPIKNEMTGINKVAAPPAVIVLKNQAISPK